MRLKRLLAVSLCGCLFVGCSTSEVNDIQKEVKQDVETTSSETQETTNVEKKNTDNSLSDVEKKNTDTSLSDVEKKNTDTSLSDDIQKIVDGAENEVHAETSDTLTLTGVYEGSYDGKVETYEIGFLSDSNNAYMVRYYTENHFQNQNEYDPARKLSHWVNGVCVTSVCGGYDNYTYSSAGEVNAALVNSRQAYTWEVIYEKEEPDFDLFEKGITPVTEEKEEEVVVQNSGSLDIQNFMNNKNNVVTFGKYEQDNNLSNGAEDIEWFKLELSDSDKILLISKYELSSVHGSGAKWSTSDMRTWLNSEFYNTAFTEAEKAKIIPNESYTTERKVTNVRNAMSTDAESLTLSADSTCSDNVFILSLNGVISDLEPIEMMGVATPYCISEWNKAYQSTLPTAQTITEEYTLRSYATRDYIDGPYPTAVVVSGENEFLTNTEWAPFIGHGIRPCIWISK